MSAEHEISPERAAELLAAGAPAVDVREDYEFEAGRIPGARHVELPQLAAVAEPIDGSAVVFYCRSGDRSAMAAEAFTAAGREAYSIAGGLLAWVEQGQALEPDTGTVAERRPGQ